MKQKKGHKRNEREADSLPLSIVIPFADDPGKLKTCIEALQKIRKPFTKDYEVILPSRQEAGMKKILQEMQGMEGLLEKGVVKILALPEESGKEDALRMGVGQSSRENILILEPDHLERSFNFDELFQLSSEEVRRHRILLPVNTRNKRKRLESGEVSRNDTSVQACGY